MALMKSSFGINDIKVFENAIKTIFLKNLNFILI